MVYYALVGGNLLEIILHLGSALPGELRGPGAKRAFARCGEAVDRAPQRQDPVPVGHTGNADTDERPAIETELCVQQRGGRRKDRVVSRSTRIGRSGTGGAGVCGVALRVRKMGGSGKKKNKSFFLCKQWQGR
jgi:hypothetical protein